jgi:hypothetical protein
VEGLAAGVQAEPTRIRLIAAATNRNRDTRSPPLDPARLCPTY